MIRLQKLTLIRGTKPLLEAADLTLNPGEKVGLIGANGCGKSSLFALLRGELHADAGDLDLPARWRIAHIDQKKLVRYGGNYSAFEQQRAIHLVLSQAAFEKQARERAHLQAFIDRFKAKATKAKQAQSRMKMLAKMEDLAPIHAAAFSSEFREPERAPNPLLVLEEVTAGYLARHSGTGRNPEADEPSWSWYCRAAHPTGRLEAITSRPLLPVTG